MIPLFKSHYSIGRSILNLKDEPSEYGPDSIVEIAKENKLREVVLVEDAMSGFLEAYKNLSENKIKLIFGVRLTICSDIKEKNENSLKTNSKVIIFCKNTNGYTDLIKVMSHAARDGFYYTPRTDYKILKKAWSDNLSMAIPFYDSFLFKNNLIGGLCIPDFSFTQPTFFTESNNLPFDSIVQKEVDNYCEKASYQVQQAKSIYYKNKKDFKAYITFRCINNRSTLDRPNLEHMCSDEFCFESWKNDR